MILGVILLERRLLLLKFDACCCELLPQILDVDRSNRKVTGHSVIGLQL